MVDVIGWFSVGLIALVVIGSSVWGVLENRKRSAVARQWAASVGLAELPFGTAGVAGDLVVHRLRSTPSFVGALDGRQVSVIATSTPVRLGRLWVLCTKVTRPPVFVGNLLGVGAARVVGWGRPKGWVDAPVAELAPHFFVSVPNGAEPVLSPAARVALLEAGVHAFCFSVSSTGFAALWFKQLYGQDTGEALRQARTVLGALVP